MQRLGGATLVGAGVMAVALIASACGSSGGGSTTDTGNTDTSSPPTTASTAASGPLVTTASNSKLGTILVTSKGFTVYRRTTDPKNGSTCTGSCASLWPPVMVPSGASIATSMSGFGTIHRSGGLQATYHGEALYTYKGDSAAGQTNGQGYGGIWFAVVTKAPGASSTTAAPGGSTWG